MIKVNNIICAVEKVCMIIASGALILMMLITAVDVTIRQVSTFTVPGALEFVEELGMPFVVFLTLSMVYYLGGNVRVELFERFFPPKLLRAFGIINAFLSIVVFVVLFWASLLSVSDAIAFGKLSNSIWAYPMAPSYLTVTIGSAMMIIRTIQSFILQLMGKNFDYFNKKDVEELDEVSSIQKVIGE